MVYPPQFLADYPLTAAALSQLVRGDPVMQGDEDRNGVKAELADRPVDQTTSAALFAAMWTEVGSSRDDFVTRTGSGFSYLGVSDEVRALIGGIWRAAFRQWNAAEQLEFLRLLLASKVVHRDLALEFLSAAIPELKVTPQEFWSWCIDSRTERGFPHRLPVFLQRYAEATPVGALTLADLFLRQLGHTGSSRFVALLVHWVREQPASVEARVPLKEFQDALAAGPIEHRSILLESWALSAASPLLDEMTAGELKRRLVRGAPEEMNAWCLVLRQLVLTAPGKLPWAVRELRLAAQVPLAGEQKLFIFTAAVHGWITAEATSTVSRGEWEGILKALAPLRADDAAIWDHLEYALVDAFEKDAASATDLVALLADFSGGGWSKVLEENRNKFTWWCQTLQTAGHAEAVITRLCFAEVRASRRIALHLLRRCGVGVLGDAAIQRATGAQVERLLLEAAVRLAEYDFLARLHLAFAGRIAEFGGELEEWFLDEALTQALNTHLYRKTILQASTAAAKIYAVVKDAERQIEHSAKASESPALKMRIPGQERAEALNLRRFGREVAKNVDKYSVFTRLFPTIQLLYGKSWRMPDATGALGEAATLKKMEVASEIPRLEFMTPEAMRHRRMMAVRRIVQLDKGVDEAE